MVEGVDTWTQTSVQTEDLTVNEGSQRQVVEQILKEKRKL